MVSASSKYRSVWLRSTRFAAAVVAAVVCAACGAAVESVPGSGPAVALDTSHALGGDPATEGTPVDGGTLRIGMDREPPSFDSTVSGSNQAASAVYDSLLKLDDKGEPQPYLAKSMTTRDNGKTWLLELREGVTFHDGTPLDAEAVLFNVRMHQDTPTSPAHNYTEPIESMTADGQWAVRFVLKRQYGSFAASLAQPSTQGNLGLIESPTAVQKWGADYGRHPVGAGPFRFVEWVPDSRIVLERFDRYWQRGLPHLDRLEFRPLPDTDSRYASVVNGDVDMIFAGYHVELLNASQNPGLVTYYGFGGGAEFLYFNLTKPPFDDRRMREAVIRAIDPRALSATQFKGAMEQAVTAFAPDDPNYSDQAAQSWPTYDPERAKELIAEYRASGGNPDFSLDAPNSPNRVNFATFMQAQLAAVGLQVEVKLSDLATASTVVKESGNYQLSTRVSGPWDSPYPYMYNLFHTGGNVNYGRYSNPEMDRVLDEAVSTVDPAKRVAAYQQAQVIANNDLAVFWYSRGYLSTITRPEVKGIVRYLSREQFWATTWLARGA